MKIKAKASKLRSIALKPYRRFRTIPAWRQAVILLLAGAVILSGFAFHANRDRYELTPGESALLSESSVEQKLIKTEANSFTYSRSEEVSKTVDKTKAISANPADADGNNLYTAKLPKNPAEGMEFTDKEGGYKVTMIPKSSLGEGRLGQGKVIYPNGQNEIHVQTFKRNGIKEDIILSEAPGMDTLTYQWELQLPNELEAKEMDSGNIGIYSGNPLLSSKLQISDDKSQELVDKARKNGEKNNLVFVIPAPYIVDAEGNTNRNDASYKLDGKTLTLTAKNMKSAKYPLSIDPSILIDTSAEFRAGTDTGMINYATANRITRSAISQGPVNAAGTKSAAFTTGRTGLTSVAYNGYLYVIGGINNSSAYLNDISYCPINTNGTIGTCVQQTNKFTNPRAYHSSVVYNGYLYIIGGVGSGAAYYNDIIYCQLTGNGSVGTCTQKTGAFTNGRATHGSVVNNGFLYITAGDQGNFIHYNDIQYCPLRANGDIGSCTQQFVLNEERSGAGAAVYDGRIYVVGGYKIDFATEYYFTDADICPLNANGSVGTCVNQANVQSGTTAYHSLNAYNGYLYITGGHTGGNFNDNYYCPIYANGTLGTCTVDFQVLLPRRDHGAVMYNDRLYIVGGEYSGGYLDDIEYLQVQTGTPTGFGAVGTAATQAAAFNAGYSSSSASVAYNGYIYISGGDSSELFTTDSIQACPINANGTIGTCTMAGSFTTGRKNHGLAAYNGYLYITGGYDQLIQVSYGDIQYCPVNGATIGTCIVDDTTIPTGDLNSHHSEAYKGFLYLIGGNAGGGNNDDIYYCQINSSDGSVISCSTYTNLTYTFAGESSSFIYNGYIYSAGGGETRTVVRCTIAVNGSISSCTQYTNKLNVARNMASSSVTVSNGFMYVTGGSVSSVNQNNLEYCPMNNDGTIGSCTTQSNSIGGANKYHDAVSADGYIYMIGGTISSGDDITRLPQVAPAHQGNYEQVIDTGSTTTAINSLQLYGSVNCEITIKYALAGSDYIFGSTTVTSMKVGGSFLSLTGGSSKRYARVAIEMNDTSCNSSGSYVTQMFLNYTAPTPPDLIAKDAPVGGDATSLTPVFRMQGQDPDFDYLRYKIELYEDDCSTLIRTIDQTLSQTGWSGQTAQSNTAYNSGDYWEDSDMATYTYQFADLTYNTGYCWRAGAIDPGHTNTWFYSDYENFTTNETPIAPTLVQPANNVTGVSATPRFELRSPDSSGDYLRYKIEICTTSNCSAILQTIDQTSSQAGWSGQNAQSSTAYSSAIDLNVSQMAIYLSQSTLNANTQYWWRAYSIDPGGTNMWSPASAISTFTVSTNNTVIKGGTTIRGGSKISN